MDSVLGSLHWTAAFAYIDEILGFLDNLNDYPSQLTTLLESAIAAGLKFNSNKYHFTYLSFEVHCHYVSTDGLSILKDRAATIWELATPDSLKKLLHV